MTEPTTPRGIAIVDASRAIGRAAENAGIAYERGEDLRCSNEERAETEARVELTKLVCEMEADLARVTAEGATITWARCSRSRFECRAPLRGEGRRKRGDQR